MKVTNVSKSAIYRLKEDQIILGGFFNNIVIEFVNRATQETIVLK
jgi:hypothetical protein